MDINPAQIAAWLKLGESVIGSSLVQKFLPQIGESLKLDEAQKVAVAANLSDYDARITRASAPGGPHGEDPDV